MIETIATEGSIKFYLKECRCIASKEEKIETEWKTKKAKQREAFDYSLHLLREVTLNGKVAQILSYLR